MQSFTFEVTPPLIMILNLLQTELLRSCRALSQIVRSYKYFKINYYFSTARKTSIVVLNLPPAFISPKAYKTDMIRGAMKLLSHRDLLQLFRLASTHS